uniref:Anoctamin n=1 Tax=Angiostrongylus cantonensis TaxID=6313 RepID=A0A158PAT1_ANGCA
MITNVVQAARKEGLIVNHEFAGPICFTLISTPFHRLCREAEKMQMSFPLKDCPVNPPSPPCCPTLFSAFVTDDTGHYISAPFSRRNCQLFLNYESEKLFFTSAQRDMLTHEILTQLDIRRELKEQNHNESDIGDESQQSVIADEPLRRKGLQYLRMKNSYEDSFILHEPSQEEPYFKKMKENSSISYMELITEIETDPRKKLNNLWSRFFRFQPLGLVREYFGQQIAFYFAWHGTFLTMLWPATVLGLAVFVYGFVKSVRLNPVTFGNCSIVNYVGESFAVSCTFRNKLAQFFTTVSSWFTNSFDNELNAFFAAFMSIWGTFFCQIWRRNNTVLAYEWDCEDFNEVEPDRPEYRGSATRIVSDTTLDHSDDFLRFLKLAVSCIVVILSMCLVIISVLLVTLYKLWAVSSQACNKEYTLMCSVMVAYLPSIMNTVSIMLLGNIYECISTSPLFLSVFCALFSLHDRAASISFSILNPSIDLPSHLSG